MPEKIRDSRSMDPVFEQVVKSLYGDSADPRAYWELRKSMPDQSGLHINGSNQKKERRLAITGLGATGVATIGGLHALKLTGEKALGLKTGYMPKHAAEEAAPKVMRKLPGGAKTAAALGTAGWLGLHGTELLGDALGARAQIKTIQATQPGKPKAVKGIKQPKAPKSVMQKRHSKVYQSNLEAARKGRRMVAVATFAGSAAGSYAATKKYHLKKVPPQQSAPKPMAVKKRDDIDFVWEGEISKVDQDKRLVFGWCSLSKVGGEPVVDLQGDYIPIEETEASAYRYVIESRKGGDMHRRVSKFDSDEPLHTADLVESVVFTPEKLVKMGLAPDALPHGWWIGMKVNDDDQWAAVKAGQRLGFSIHGKGRRVEKALDISKRAAHRVPGIVGTRAVSPGRSTYVPKHAKVPYIGQRRTLTRVDNLKATAIMHSPKLARVAEEATEFFKSAGDV